MRAGQGSMPEVPGCFSLVAMAIVLFAIGVLSLSGCGVPAIRAHATAALGAHDVMQAADAAITAGAEAAIATCPADDGPTRAECLAGKRQAYTTAAAAHDVLIAPVAAYRAEVLESCGIDPSTHPTAIPDSCDPPADIMTIIERLAGPVAAHLPELILALDALGVHVPSITVPGGN